MCAAADPVLDSVKVEADEFLVVDVGKGVVGAQLLYIFTISRPFVVSCHDAIKGPVGLFVACESQSDDNVTSVVLLQQEGCCGMKQAQRALSEYKHKFL